MKHWKFTLLGLTMVLALFAWTVSRSHAQDHHKMGKMHMMMHKSKEVKQAEALVMKIKKSAEAKGMYNCCLKHSCNDCALAMGMCPCGKMLSMGKPVCNECKGAWYAHDGDIPGVKPDQVKTFPRGMKM